MADHTAEATSDSESTASTLSDNILTLQDQLGAVGGKDVEFTTMDSETAIMEAQAGPSGQMAGAESAIDKLLQKQRNEIMFELRRLKMGEKPVTGQDNKKNVEDFFTRAMADTPAPTEEHRPEAVVVEVDALVERRPVSSLLESRGFRRRLENALRTSFNSVAGRTQAERTQRNSASPRAGSPSAAFLANQAAVREGLANSHSSIRSAMTASSGSSNGRTQARVTVTPHIPPPPAPAPTPESLLTGISQPVAPSVRPAAPETPAPSALPQLPTGPARAQAWLQQVPEVNNPGEQVFMWDTVEQAQQEAFIEEISELVQRQLVTSTLQGQFRSTLENSMLNRLERTGADGNRVADFVRSIPQTQPHYRNDFSDLGINVQQGGVGSDADAISIISATAAVHVPQQQMNASMNHEIRSLKAQIQELKNMMKMSFEMQLDTQRAIRQEVAAALATGPSEAALPIQSAVSRPFNDAHCVICLDKAADCVMYQCGHMCACYTCGMELKNRGAKCPVCRAPIKDIIRAYRSTQN